MGSTFADVSALSPTGTAGRFDADVSPDWTIAGRPNGGYLLAMLGRAAVGTGAHPHVVAAAATYVSAPEPGPVEIEAEVLRGGRSASQLRGRLMQGGRACVEALFTTAELPADSTPHWSRVELPDLAGRDDCIRIPAVTPLGDSVPIMGEVDLRIDPADLGFTSGRPSGRGELRGWLTLPDDEPFDPISLLYAIDAFPPATFEVQPTGWVPTLELTAYVRALPAPGPLRILHRAHLVEAGRVDELCLAWDSRGRLVAQGTQLAGVRLG